MRKGIGRFISRGQSRARAPALGGIKGGQAAAIMQGQQAHDR